MVYPVTCCLSDSPTWILCYAPHQP